jgi:hypothetical protein
MTTTNHTVPEWISDRKIYATDTESIPWTPFPGVEGDWFKILHMDDDNFSATVLLRTDPSFEPNLHRHLGAAELFNLKGSWGYEGFGIMGPGGYTYEPGGVVHFPHVEDEIIVLAILHGPIQPFDADGNPLPNLVDNDVFYRLAKANDAVGHLSYLRRD